MKRKVLIIGYGNTLRNDDGLGNFVITQLKKYITDEATLKTYHQIDLSQLDEIKEYDQVIFIDANLNTYSEEVHIEEIKPIPSAPCFTSHISSLPSLLSLVEVLYQKKTKAYLVTVKGYDFSYGNQLTKQARHSAKKALQKILEILKSQ